MIYVLLADGFEEIEAIAPVDFLRRCGLSVRTLSVSDSRTVIGAHGIPVAADGLLTDGDFSHAEMVILPGGMPGTKHLDEHPQMTDLLTQVREHGGYLCAICAAPSVLGNRGFLRGKRAVCYPGFEDRLTGAVLTGSLVIRDGKIITAKAAGVAWQFAYACASVLTESAICDRVRDGLYFAGKECL